MKLTIICLLVILTGCTTTRPIASIARTPDAAKQAVPFCGTAKPSWGEAVEGDPGRTKAQKAAFNAAGRQLKCAGF